jgi:dihydropteroate synthase
MNRTLTWNGHELEFGKKTWIMGILNVTPDSFSDGGSYVLIDAAVERAVQMVEEGADIIDIGGESTRPGYAEVGVDEELARVIPVIEAMRGKVNVPISIDTYKAEVAGQALHTGASIINDVWGFKRDPEMADVAAKQGCPVILMHNRPQPQYEQHFLQDVLNDLRECVAIAKAAGVLHNNIILDPGIGFGKTYEHNIWLMNRLADLKALGYPLLLGTSRKSMIRTALQLPSNDCVEGTAATVALGIAQGCDIVRVHDVKAMKRVAAMSDAIVRSTFTM